MTEGEAYQDPDRSGTHNYLIAVFLISGFSGIIYESVWSHYLKLLMGHAAYAQTLVLIIFMGGMAGGAWLASRFGRGTRNVLVAYALVEGLIGVFGFLFHEIFTGANHVLFSSILPAMKSPFLIVTVKWCVSVLLILPQSMLLGATFPLMSTSVIRLAPERTGAVLGILYFVNSIGAAIGILVAAFVLIPRLGLPGTLITAGLLNTLITVAALAVRRVAALRHESHTSLPEKAISDRVLNVAAFVTGAASFCYEIAWIRMLVIVLGSTVQAFEIMVSAFITGLAFGGLWIRKRLDSIDSPLRFAAFVQILMALAAAATLPAYNHLFDLQAFLLNAIQQNREGYIIFNFSSHAMALLVMVPATFLAGTTLPLFTFEAIRRGRGESAIGRIYAANTLGAIAGVVASVHGFMPLGGLTAVLLAGTSADLLLGLFLLSTAGGLFRGRIRSATVVLSVLLLAGLISSGNIDPLRTGGGVFRRKTAELSGDWKSVFHKDGRTATVDVLERPGQHLMITTNGKPDAAVGADSRVLADEYTMALLALLPMAANPSASDIAVIGLGAGVSSHTVLGAAGIARVDTVEIEPAILEGARHFGKFSERVFLDPRSRIIIDDAKTFFSTHGGMYDIIISEPSNPWVSGVAGLFTEEFYENMRRHLKPGGVLSQWFHLYEIEEDEVVSVFKALESQFPHYSVYIAGTADIVILASADRPLRNLSGWIFSEPALQEGLRRLNFRSVADLAARRIAEDRLLSPVIKQSAAPPNSDFYPYLAFQTARSRFLGARASLFIDLQNLNMPLLEYTGIQPSYVGTGVQEAPLFVIPAKRAAALHTTNAIVGPASYKGEVPEKLQYDAAVLNSLRHVCNTEIPEDILVTALFDIGEYSIPYLDKEENRTLWESALPADCLASRSKRVANWLSLQQSLARRDYSSAAAPARAILRSGIPVSQQQFQYLVEAALMGIHQSEGPEAALSFLRGVQPQITGPFSESLAFRMLETHVRLSAK